MAKQRLNLMSVTTTPATIAEIARFANGKPKEKKQHQEGLNHLFGEG